MSQKNTEPQDPAAPARFGMPQAMVGLGFVAAAVVLRLVAGMSLRDSVTLLAAAGAVGVALPQRRRETRSAAAPVECRTGVRFWQLTGGR